MNGPISLPRRWHPIHFASLAEGAIPDVRDGSLTVARYLAVEAARCAALLGALER